MTRAEYDGERMRVLMAGLSMGEDEARKQLEREYPKCTDAAIAELQRRGLSATEWRVHRHCTLRPKLAPPVVGGSRAWGKQHIDDFAEILESHGCLMPSAIYRAELGVSWSEEQAIRRRIKAEKEARDEQ
jgi:hypothetical protein